MPNRSTPTALLQLDPKVENLVSALTKLLNEEEVNLDAVENMLSPKAIRETREEFERLGAYGEQTLDVFVEEIMLSELRRRGTQFRGFPHREGSMALLGEAKATRTYNAFARCGNDIYRMEPLIMRRKDILQLRDMDERFERQLIPCTNCSEQGHPPVKTFIQYDLGNFNTYLDMRAQITMLEDARDRTPARQRGKRKVHEINIEKLRKQQAEIDREYDVLGIRVRVKGNDSFALKLTDRIYDARRQHVVHEAIRKKVLSKQFKIEDEQEPTAIKDYLGCKVIVVNDQAKDLTVRHLEWLDRQGKLQLHSVKDYWGEPRIVTRDDQSRKIGQKRDYLTGEVIFEGWKAVCLFNGMPIEVQIQTVPMLAIDTRTHMRHHEYLRSERQLLEEAGIPYQRTVALISRLLER